MSRTAADDVCYLRPEKLIYSNDFWPNDLALKAQTDKIWYEHLFVSAKGRAYLLIVVE